MQCICNLLFCVSVHASHVLCSKLDREGEPIHLSNASNDSDHFPEKPALLTFQVLAAKFDLGEVNTRPATPDVHFLDFWVEISPLANEIHCKRPDVLLNDHIRPPSGGDPVCSSRQLVRNGHIRNDTCQVIAPEAAANAIEKGKEQDRSFLPGGESTHVSDSELIPLDAQLPTPTAPPVEEASLAVVMPEMSDLRCVCIRKHPHMQLRSSDRTLASATSPRTLPAIKAQVTSRKLIAGRLKLMQ